MEIISRLKNKNTSKQRISQHKMRPTATVVELCVCVSFCLAVTSVNCVKAAEPTEMPFSEQESYGPKKHVFGGGAHLTPPGKYC